MQRARPLALVFGLLLALTCGSCSSVDSTAPHFRVVWGALGDPSTGIPDDVESLLLLVYLPDSDEPEDSSFTVASLRDADGNGRRELVRPDLPVGAPIRLVLLGGPSEGDWTHMGSVGPLVLTHGERRYVDIRMYSLTSSNVVSSGAPSARFLHTTTALSDGRVLIAGGFSRASATPCPASVTTDATCFDLTATDDAAIFDPATAQFHRLASPMLAARGGHTASLLPDGRVLLAGGVNHAILVMSEISGHNVEFGVIADDDTTTPASYEIFEPDAHAAEEDTEANGDPGRGGFVGSADAPSRPGPLDTGRAFHAASALADGRVVLSGGLLAADSFTVWDTHRPGGYGVLGTGALTERRAMPGSAVLGTGATQRVFIAGNGAATSDEALAEIWLGEGLGSTTSANISTTTGAPQWDLIRPIVESAANGRGALVLGWYGPWCASGTDTPSYAEVGAGQRCGYAANRAYTFEVATNRATASPSMRPHALGASTVLDDGSVVVTGGLSGLTLETNGTIDAYGSVITAGSLPNTPLAIALGQKRALHAMAPIADGGAFVFGGATFNVGTSRTMTLVASPEVFFVPRPRGR